jgi:UPF0755 protein
MDIKPPTKRRPPAPVRSESSPVVGEPGSDTFPAELLEVPQSAEQPFSIHSSEGEQKKERRRLSVVKKIIIGILAFLLVAATGLFGWYSWAIAPASSDSNRQGFTIEAGETPSVIAKHLEQARLIRSAIAFEVYAKLNGHADNLQAGSYRLSPSQSVAVIVSELRKGQNATYNVLIPPGLTLKQLADPSVKSSFAFQGFSAEEIQRAFAATYDSPLLKDKPVGASLEGYIFPETFQVKEGGSLESVLQRSFDTLYERLSADGLIAKFAAHGLTLHQALTLGSIVQKETSIPATQRQVAQVFLTRLNIGMTLGSDVTFIYAAKQLGVEATPTLDSPYNTRIHGGLPPGPIATMNYSALQAVAEPAEGDYLFFVAGDDGTVHFSRTNEEHEQQVQQYCQQLCSATQ